MKELLEAIYAALGSLTQDGEAVPVYVRGAQPKDVPAPSVLIEIPESTGFSTMDRAGYEFLRLTIRIHDRETDGFYPLRRIAIADKVIAALRPNVTAGSTTVAMIQPDQRPVHYTAEGDPAHDQLLIYRTLLT